MTEDNKYSIPRKNAAGYELTLRGKFALIAGGALATVGAIGVPMVATALGSDVLTQVEPVRLGLAAAATTVTAMYVSLTTFPGFAFDGISYKPALKSRILPKLLLAAVFGGASGIATTEHVAQDRAFNQRQSVTHPSAPTSAKPQI